MRLFRVLIACAAVVATPVMVPAGAAAAPQGSLTQPRSSAVVAESALDGAAAAGAPRTLAQAAPGAVTARLALDGPAAAGVRVTALRPATGSGSALSLPVVRVRAGRLSTTIEHSGRLRLRAGGRTFAIDKVRTVLGQSAVVRGRVGRRTVDVLRLELSSGRRQALAGANTVALDRVAVTLTPAAAKLARERLRVPRLRSGRLGRLTLRVIGQDTTVIPAPAGAAAPTGSGGVRKIVGGTASWGVSSGLRELFKRGDVNTSHPDQPMRTLSDGAVQLDDDTFGLTVVGGWFDPASGRAQVALAGGIRFGYYVGGWTKYPPADGIAHGIWASFGALTATLGPSGGTLEGLTDAGFHERAWIRPERRAFADLAAPAASADATTATWTVPARLNAAGGPLGLGYFPPGTALDALTITARLGD